MDTHNWLLEHESLIRLSVFFTVLSTMIILETRIPRRQLLLSRWVRWPSNLGLVVFNSLLLRLLFPTAAVGIAMCCEQKQIGLLHFIAAGNITAVLFAIVILDLVIYFQHVLVHRIPLLWRLHQVHHADLDYDVTTGSRFHPLEILLSMIIKTLAITALGAPALAVIIFEIVLNGMAMFNHSNIHLPAALDSAIRKVFVTPDMHRVHHSTKLVESNRNFGFNLSLWDRIFKTYQAQPTVTHESMEIGLTQYRNPEQAANFFSLLNMPFKK